MMQNRLRTTLQAAILLIAGATGALRAEDYAITTFAGTSNVAGSADGTPGSFNNPYGMAMDSAKNLYVADTLNNTIRKITPLRVVTTLAGSAGFFGTTDGTGSAARFNFPVGIAVDSSGNVYVADAKNFTIRKITSAGVVTTFAGAPFQFGSTDGAAASARFFLPYGVAVDSTGNVYVADGGNHLIRKITPAGVVSTLAGAAQQSGSADGTGSAARFNTPFGLAVDRSGNVYVADSENHTIRKITPAGAVTTVAGAAGAIGAADGAAAAARFNQPRGLSVDAAGNIYVADHGNSTVRQITAGGTVSTLAGSAGLIGEVNSVGSAARFYYTTDVVADGSTIYVVDSSNNLIRKGVPASQAELPVISVQPLNQEVSVGQSVTYQVVASGSGLTYQWLKNQVAISGATGASFTIPSAQASDVASYKVRITGAGGSIDSDPGTLSVSPVAQGTINVTARPISQSVAVGQSATFSISASGTGLSYQWSKDGTAIAGATGASYTIASAQTGNAGTYEVRVTSGSSSVTASAKLLVGGSAGPGPGPAPGGPSSRLVNLSILTNIATTGDAFTMGYVVGGAGTSGSKPILIRAAGPTLGAAPFNISGTLNDPRIELFAGTTKTSENDNWGGSASLSNAFAAVGAFAYVNGTSLDAAALASIAPGDNSVRVSATGSGTGIVIAELYDSTPFASLTATSPRLVNVSVLKHLGTGLTAGFVIDGSASKRVLIRAVGPTIGAAPFNVPGAVADPQLTLYSGQTVIGSNDNWGGTTELTAAFSQVGAFTLPASSRDAAILVTLQPGSYTVQASGVDGTTGVAIVEVYEVP